MKSLNGTSYISIFNQETEFSIDEQNSDWVGELLHELNENIDVDSNDPLEDETFLNIELKISRDNNSLLKEYVTITGNLETKFLTQCVRCLEPMIDELYLEFEGCFISDELENDPHFADIDTVLVKNQEMNLYFHHNRKIDIKEFIHEQIYLHCNPNPLHAPDCKGLCQVCGINLNKQTCIHKQS